MSSLLCFWSVARLGCGAKLLHACSTTVGATSSLGYLFLILNSLKLLIVRTLYGYPINNYLINSLALFSISMSNFVPYFFRTFSTNAGSIAL